MKENCGERRGEGACKSVWAEEASSFVEIYPRSEGQHAYARMKRAIGKLLAANTKQVLKLLGAETTSTLLPLA